VQKYSIVSKKNRNLSVGTFLSSTV